MRKLGIYIHIPFCQSKCYYCDFNSGKGDEEQVQKYIDALIKEIKLYSSMRSQKVHTVFIGGGTPTYIDSRHIVQVMSELANSFDLSEVLEVTIECNPGSVDENKVRDYLSAGINRFSIGLQSTNDSIIKSVGRIHNYSEFIDTVGLIKGCGGTNISGDLMIGLPGQRIEDVIKSIDDLSILGINHVSMYSLKLEEGTAMMKMYDKGLIELPDEEEEREMYHQGINRLRYHGYKQYEISNFAKEGFESKHNLLYWELDEYVGLGLGSSGYLGDVRYSNHYNMDDYITSIDNSKKPISEEEIISNEELMYECMILGLRLNKGISKEEILEKTGVDFLAIYNEEIEKNIKNGLMVIENGRYKLTSIGFDLSNQVFVDFIPK